MWSIHPPIKPGGARKERKEERKKKRKNQKVDKKMSGKN